MKKIYILGFVIIAALAANAQNTKWYKTYGGSYNDQANDIIQINNGNVLLLGTVTSDDGDIKNWYGHEDAWLTMLNDTGKILWSKNYGGFMEDVPKMIQQTKDGGFVIAGYTSSMDQDVVHLHTVQDTFMGNISITTNNEFWILKLTADGKIEWSKTYGGYHQDEAYAIKQTSDNGYIVVGSTTSNNDGDVSGVHGKVTFNSKPNDIWVIKLSSAGEMEWSKALGGSKDEEAFDVIQTKDDGFIVVGSAISRDGDVTGSSKHSDTSYSDSWITKIDKNGIVKWNKTLGGSFIDVSTSMTILKDGSIAVAGNAFSSDGDLTLNANRNMWVINMNENGTINWSKTYGGFNTDMVNDIVATIDGGFIIAGFSNSYPVISDYNRVWPQFNNSWGIGDGWVLKVNKDGDAEWDKAIGGSENDEIAGIVQTQDGGYLTASTTNSTGNHAIGNHGESDLLLVKFAAIKATIKTDWLCNGDTYKFDSRFHTNNQLKNSGKYFAIYDKGKYDSTIILYLNVQAMDFSGISKNGSTLEANESSAANYKWMNCKTKQVVAGSNLQKYSPTASGDYAVIVTKNGCIDTSACVNIQLGGIDKSYSNKVLFYPNPAQNDITIENATNISAGTIYDLNGKLIYTFTDLSNPTLLNVDFLPNGCYMLKISDYNNSKAILKLVIAR